MRVCRKGAGQISAGDLHLRSAAVQQTPHRSVFTVPKHMSSPRSAYASRTHLDTGFVWQNCGHATAVGKNGPQCEIGITTQVFHSGTHLSCHPAAFVTAG